MNEECRYIIELAKQYKIYSENSEELFLAINQLSESDIRDILADYARSENVLQPTNLLRVEIARKVLNDHNVNAEVIEEIKDKIRRKDTGYFAHLPPDVLLELENRHMGSRDIFASWQRPWSLFYTFFYRGEIKQKVQSYLNQICERLLTDLELADYKSRWFDFAGANNFGSVRCWLALFPKAMSSHKDAYQFFLSLEDVPRVGIGAGFSLDNPVKDEDQPYGSYEDALDILHSHRDEIINLNKQLLQSSGIKKRETNQQKRKYYKFAPGGNASEWERFKAENIIAADYDNLAVKDISDIESLPELNAACGFGDSDNSFGGTWHLWLLKSANIGDVVFVNKGVMNCIGIGIIEGDYYYDENAKDYWHRRKMRWLTDKTYEYIPYALPTYPRLFRPDTFSPTKVWQFLLSEYARLYPELKEVFDSENLNYEAPQTIEPELELSEIIYETESDESAAAPYDFQTDPDKPFISFENFFQAVALLKRKKNIILQGSPGVGKTFIARKIAYQIIGRKADSQIEMVQFHQSFAYEDFVQGLRLVKDGVQIKNGVFYNFCKLAAHHPEQKFFFIIDEINRGNLSKIFGELMMLIEHDKRDEKFALKLTYAENEGEKFFVPPNVYLIGTMNTADRSLAIVDYALRRRFAFVTLEPEFGVDFQSFLCERGVSENLTAHICRSISEINQTISADPNLGEGFQIGHSYFCDAKIDGDETQWFSEILNFEIEPLLKEIWFDDQKQIDEMLRKLNL